MPPITIKYQAPLWRRIAAMIYDSFIIVAVSFTYSAIVQLVVYFISPPTSTDYTPTIEGPLFQLGWLCTIALFYIFFWVKAGQTVGMKAWKLKVETYEGKHPSIKHASLRFIGAILSLSFFGAGYVWCLFSKNNATFHDIFSATCTVSTNKHN